METFTSLHVYRVDGYPLAIDASTFSLAFYIQTGTFLLSPDDMASVVNSASSAVSTALGMFRLSLRTLL